MHFKLLVIDDYESVRKTYQMAFARPESRIFPGGHIMEKLSVAGTTSEALAIMKNERHEVVVTDLDLNEDEDEEFQIVRELRKQDLACVIIAMTGQPKLLDDKRTAFKVLIEAGGDQYLKSKFEFDEVTATIGKFVSNYAGRQTANVRLGPIEFNPTSRYIVKNDVRSRLTPNECEVLKYLIAAARPVSNKELEKAIWESCNRNRQSVVNAIWKIRQVIEDNTKIPTRLITVDQDGYQLLR